MEKRSIVLLKDNPAIEKAHKVYEDFTSDEQLMDMAEAAGPREVLFLGLPG